MPQFRAVGFRKVAIELDDGCVLLIETGEMSLQSQQFEFRREDMPPKHEVTIQLTADRVTLIHQAPPDSENQSLRRIEYGTPHLASEGNKAIRTGERNPRQLNRPSSEEGMGG
jgi:hypothetical protein